MHNFVHILLRILAGTVGALLLYVAFFLYEDEEARLQNRLEEIWTRIDALQSGTISREVAFLQGVARTTSAILNRLFGRHLVALRSIAISMTFSFASGSFLWGVYTGRTLDIGTRSYPLAVLSLLLFSLGSLPSCYLSRGMAATALCVMSLAASILVFGDMIGVDGHLAIALVVLTSLLTSGLLIRGGVAVISTVTKRPRKTTKPARLFYYGLIILALSAAPAIFPFLPLLGQGGWYCFVVLSDIMFIAFFRWLLRGIRRVESLWVICMYLGVAFIVTALLTGPLIFRFLDQPFDDGLVGFLDRWLGHPFPDAFGWSATKSVDILCLLLLIGVMLLLLLHRLTWPMMKRLFHATNRTKLVQNKRLLSAVGVILITYAYPSNPIVKWVTDFLPRLKGGG